MIKGRELSNKTIFEKEVDERWQKVSVKQEDSIYKITDKKVSFGVHDINSIELPEDMALSLFFALNNELVKNKVFEKYELIGDTLKKKGNEKVSKIITG